MLYKCTSVPDIMDPHDYTHHHLHHQHLHSNSNRAMKQRLCDSCFLHLMLLTAFTMQTSQQAPLSSNDPFNSGNVQCLRSTNTTAGQLLQLFYANLSLDGIVTSAVRQMRNESMHLWSEFEANYNRTPWQNFTLRQQWHFDTLSCVFNIILAEEILRARSAIRSGTQPSFVYVKDIVPGHNLESDLRNLLQADRSAVESIDEYFTNWNPNQSEVATRGKVLTAVETLEKNANIFANDAVRLSRAVHNARSAKPEAVLAPEDEASIQVLLLYANWLPRFVLDYKNKFKAYLMYQALKRSKNKLIIRIG